MFLVGPSTLADDVKLACDKILFLLHWGHPRCAVVACRVCIGVSVCSAIESSMLVFLDNATKNESGGIYVVVDENQTPKDQASS